jgi:polyisoprenoid-binding protein YceI/rhodanese-related sulfurtransferase
MITITADQLNNLTRDESDLKIIDVRLSEHFDRERLPGTQNNCVFEIDFVERILEMVPEKGLPICVYGAAADSYESKVATEKLERTGYKNVYDFRGGVDAWREAGFAVEGTGQIVDQEQSPVEGKRPIDTSESLVEWTGQNLGSKHWGSLQLKSGQLEFGNGCLVSGFFVLDMHSITDLNIENKEMRKVLEEHLKSDGFFDCDRFPEAKFELTNVDSIAGATLGTPNFNFTGDFTLKGITQGIQFNAVCEFNDEGQWIAQANFDLDRTRWNIIYGSGRFFRGLGMHVVNDFISLQLKIVA